MPTLEQDWVRELPLQQQSVLLMATRGCDGMPKHHGAKCIVRCIRACVGRPLRDGETLDTYASMREFGTGINANAFWWNAVQSWDNVVDELPLHFFQHVAGAANILRTHPSPDTAQKWAGFYGSLCTYMHMEPETVEAMRSRCDGDWWLPPSGGSTHTIPACH